MKKLRLCIGSNDGQTIAKTHMGDTEYFYIYDISENVQPQMIDKRDNTAKTMDHAKSEKMKAIIGIVSDADVFVARQKSPNFVNIAKKTKYQPIVVKDEKIADALKTVQASFSEIYESVSKKKNGEVSDTVIQLV